MFKFLKEKLANAVSVFSKKAEQESEVVEKLEPAAGEREEEEKITEEEKEETKEEEEKKSEEDIAEMSESKIPSISSQSSDKHKETKEKIEKEYLKQEEKPSEERKEEVKKDEVKEDKEKEIETADDKPVQKKGFFSKIFSKKEKETLAEKEPVEEKQAPAKTEGDTEEEKKHVFSSIKDKITKTVLSEKKFDELFWDLEVALMENNVAVEVIEKIKKDLKNEIVGVQIRRGELLPTIIKSLKKSIGSLFEVSKFNLLDIVKAKKPCVICFVGINGSGKTTTIAKFVKLFQDNGLKCVIAAADTFRAAAIDQLQLHADKLGVKLIRQDYGSDAAAVAFDSIKHAEAKQLDVVLIDTAGRMHSNTDLMEEMKKIVRVSKPHLKLFIGESITGNDCVEQAKSFNDAVGIDGIVLSKADVDEKGGAAVSVSYVTGKPILYIGVGQNYDDLIPFDSDSIIKSLGLES